METSSKREGWKHQAVAGSNAGTPVTHEALHGRTLTLEVARLRAPEAGGQLLQSLRQGAHHVAKQPLFLLRAGPAGLAGQCLHGTLAPVEELGEQVALTAGRRVCGGMAQGAPRPLRSPARVRHTALCPDRLAPRTAKRSMLSRTWTNGACVRVRVRACARTLCASLLTAFFSFSPDNHPKRQVLLLSLPFYRREHWSPRD